MKNFKWESLVIGVAIVLAGYLLKNGLQSFAEKDQYVSVRGLATREVNADFVNWPIVVKLTGNNLSALNQQIAACTSKVETWLKGNGINEADISQGVPKLTDRKANTYDAGNVSERYLIVGIVTVSTKQVDKVRALLPRIGELVAQDVPVAADDYEHNISYDFLGLNDIKPAMIEEATKNARIAAEKFAQDSGSRLGSLRSARQGLFEIHNRDEFTPYIKTVRVVTNVDYNLNH